MSIDYSALKNEIMTGPLAATLAPMIASGNDNGIAAALNARDNTRSAFVSQIPLSLLTIWAAKTGVRGKIEAHALNTASPVQSVCLALRDMLISLTGPALDAANADNLAMMDACTQAGVLAASGAGSKADLLAAAHMSPASRAEEAALVSYGGQVTNMDVAKALRGTT